MTRTTLHSIGAALLLLLSACEEHLGPDRPGPPSLVKALAVEVGYAPNGVQYGYLPTTPLGMGDPTSSTTWALVRDLLAPGPMDPPVFPVVVLRLVFSELLDGDAVEIVDASAGKFSLVDGAVTVTAMSPGATAPTPVTMLGHYDPSGTLLGAPPGPALVLRPAPALPTASLISVTVSGSLVKDTTGKPMGADRTITFQTLPLVMAQAIPALDTGMPVNVSMGITLLFTSLLAAESVTPAAFSLTRADGTNVSFDVVAAAPLGFVVAPHLMITGTVTAGEKLTLGVKQTITDVHKLPLVLPVSQTFTVAGM